MKRKLSYATKNGIIKKEDIIECMALDILPMLFHLIIKKPKRQICQFPFKR